MGFGPWEFESPLRHQPLSCGCAVMQSCCRAQECGRHLSRGSSGAEFETAPSTVCYVVAALRAAFRNVGGTSGAESASDTPRSCSCSCAVVQSIERRNVGGTCAQAPQVPNSRCPSNRPAGYKACGSALANESSQSCGLLGFSPRAQLEVALNGSQTKRASGVQFPIAFTPLKA